MLEKRGHPVHTAVLIAISWVYLRMPVFFGTVQEPADLSHLTIGVHLVDVMPQLGALPTNCPDPDQGWKISWYIVATLIQVHPEMPKTILVIARNVFLQAK